MYVIGVDESGRGPVLGPMVLCAYAIDEKREPELRQIGVKDSKLLSPSQREALYGNLLKMGKASVIEVQAPELNDLMHKRVSLNEIEAIKIAIGLKEFKKLDVSAVYVDSPDPGNKFELRIRKYFKTDWKIVSENKADYKYPCVGAASIVAKVVRDRAIEQIKKEVGEDFGSGYSHDERTIDFLKRHIMDDKHPLHRHVRTKWETYRRLKVTQVSLKDYF